MPSTSWRTSSPMRGAFSEILPQKGLFVSSQKIICGKSSTCGSYQLESKCDLPSLHQIPENVAGDGGRSNGWTVDDKKFVLTEVFASRGDSPRFNVYTLLVKIVT